MPEKVGGLGKKLASAPAEGQKGLEEFPKIEQEREKVKRM